MSNILNAVTRIMFFINTLLLPLYYKKTNYDINDFYNLYIISKSTSDCSSLKINSNEIIRLKLFCDFFKQNYKVIDPQIFPLYSFEHLTDTDIKYEQYNKTINTFLYKCYNKDFNQNELVELSDVNARVRYFYSLYKKFSSEIEKYLSDKKIKDDNHANIPNSTSKPSEKSKCIMDMSGEFYDSYHENISIYQKICDSLHIIEKMEGTESISESLYNIKQYLFPIDFSTDSRLINNKYSFNEKLTVYLKNRILSYILFGPIPNDHCSPKSLKLRIFKEDGMYMDTHVYLSKNVFQTQELSLPIYVKADRIELIPIENWEKSKDHCIYNFGLYGHIDFV